MYNNTVKLMLLRNRANKLATKPVENLNLLRKVKRQIRKLEATT